MHDTKLNNSKIVGSAKVCPVCSDAYYEKHDNCKNYVNNKKAAKLMKNKGLLEKSISDVEISEHPLKD